MISGYADKLFRNFSCTGIIKTKVGIKPVNQIANSDWFNEIVIKSVTDLEFNQCVLHPDFLKDKYTSIGKNISESPHYDLIRHLDNNSPLDGCDYFKRCHNGTLDFRKKIKISEECLKKYYQKKLTAMTSGEVFSVKVFLVYNNTYMIADGKHFLAMASYHNYPNLRFDIIYNLLFDTYFRWIFEKIKKDKDFKKHNDFFRRAYEYRKAEIDRIGESGFNKQPD